MADSQRSESSADQNIFDHQAIFEQFSQNQKNVATAMMIDPTLPLQNTQNNTLQHGGTSNVSTSHEALNPAPASSSRNLPSPDINSSSVENAYVEFIFYCNPSVSLSTDTTALRKSFQSMPKTDGQSFDTFVLFELIKKLEAKEIETWSQLVIELGVEPPDPSKNQSAQKVQQFAVRMKRWLHALHIDAFFQYCLGKLNSYYVNVPSPEEPINSMPRDGVPPEEDLALRALLPEWRPKRGRRKADHHEGGSGSQAKRIQRDGSLNPDSLLTAQDTTFSAHPQSAFPWDQQANQEDPWTAANRAMIPRTDTSMAPQQPFHGQQNFWVDMPGTVPATAYPQSAITPRHNQSAYSSSDLPRSAHPMTGSSSNRPRKRHGPAVSAAWPSGSPSTGKLPRGRPPSNRSVQDGPFSTFPANPQSREGTPKDTGTPFRSTTLENIPQTPEITTTNASITNTPISATNPHSQARKPSKLSLQVPQHAGGPVRLATPPPKVLVNGADGNQARSSSRYRHHERRTSAEFSNSIEDDMSELGDETSEDDERAPIDWKRRAITLKRKLNEKEAELKAMKKRVLEAVM